MSSFKTNWHLYMTYCRFANKLGKQYIFSSMVTLLCITNLLFSIIIISILHIAPTIKHLPVRYAYYMATILTLDSCRLQILNLFAVNLLVQLPGQPQYVSTVLHIGIWLWQFNNSYHYATNRLHFLWLLLAILLQYQQIYAICYTFSLKALLRRFGIKFEPLMAQDPIKVMSLRSEVKAILIFWLYVYWCSYLLYSHSICQFYILQ